MKNLLLMLLMSVAAVVASSENCYSQSPARAGVRGTGEAVLERKPALMRMHLQLLAKGKDLTEAIARLSTQRAEVEKQLETLGAVKTSIHFSEIELDQTQDRAERQIEMIMRRRMAQKRGGKGSAKNDAIVKPAKVRMTLTAEWPLTVGEAAETLIAVEKLQKTIQAADWGGTNDSEELTPEEEELAEEMEGADFVDQDESGHEPGQPTFVFVANIEEADREQALSEAFAEAKQQAEVLAKAAELKLGTLISLEADTGMEADEDADYRLRYDSSMFSVQRRQMSGHNRAKEVIGTSPSLLKYRVIINATFAYQ